MEVIFVKRIVSLLLVIIILFSNNINVFADRIKEIEIEDYIYYESKGDITNITFTEIFHYEDGSKLMFEHYIENNNKTIAITDRDGSYDIVAYDNENFTLTLNNQEIPYFDGGIEVYYNNSWFISDTKKKRYAVANFTKASLAASLALFAGCPVNAMLVVVAGAYYSTMWFSAEKITYMCYNYNGSYKVGWYHKTGVYADRNWSDYLATFTTTVQTR